MFPNPEFCAFPVALIFLHRQPQNSGFGKLLRLRVTLGPSPGGIRSPPPPTVHLHSSFVSPNRFEPLVNATPEYRPLRYVDVDVKARESSKWMLTRVLLAGCQGSFINDKLSTRYQLPRLVKPAPISLILADGSPSKGSNVTHFNPLILWIASNEEAIGLDIAPTTHDIVLGSCGSKNTTLPFATIATR